MLCVVASLAAIAIQGGRPDGALGVLAGTGLMAFSFRVIRQGFDVRAQRAVARPAGSLAGEPTSIWSQAWTITKYATRYGVLAVAGWVALVPLRASPVGLFVGVSIPVLALGWEVLRSGPRGRH